MAVGLHDLYIVLIDLEAAELLRKLQNFPASGAAIETEQRQHTPIAQPNPSA